MKISTKTVTKIACAVILAVTVVITAVFTGSAELVNVYTKNDPELTLTHIYSEKCIDGWYPEGTMTPKGNGAYNLTSNSWCFWSSYDAIDFVNTKTAFNTGSGSILTVSVNIDNFITTNHYSSAGIMVRDSLDADSKGVFLFIRGGSIYIMARQEVAQNPKYTPVETTIAYPAQLKLVINKDRKKAYGYFTAKDGKEIPVGPISYEPSSTQLYVGVADHTSQKAMFDSVDFSKFSVSLDAPEGYEIEDEGNTGDTPDKEEEKEETVKLPEDLEVTENTLLKETFTTNLLLEDPDGSKESVTNPLWTVRKGKPVLQVNDVETNRYLLLASLDDPIMMTAGDMNWADYRASAQISFISGYTSLAEPNDFQLLLRHRSMVIGGSSDYCARIVNKFTSGGELDGQYLQLCYREAETTFAPKKLVVLSEVCLAEKGMVEYDVPHTITAEVFDDTMTVSFNGEQLISYPNGLSEEDRKDGERHPIGCVGIYATTISAKIDNITVTDIIDPNGGDYDNIIGGRYNEPIPDYIEEYFKYE